MATAGGGNGFGSLRMATVDDAAAIARVHLESRRTTYLGLLPNSELGASDAVIERFTGEWRERLAGAASARLVLVLEDDRGAVVGFAAAGWNEPGAEFPCELYSIYLLVAAQRHGGGRRLFDAVVTHFRGQGAASLVVWVLERNPSRGFYEALGGTMVGKRTLLLGGVELEEVAYLWRLI